jgi:hypothetical protein
MSVQLRIEMDITSNIIFRCIRNTVENPMESFRPSVRIQQREDCWKNSHQIWHWYSEHNLLTHNTYG